MKKFKYLIIVLLLVIVIGFGCYIINDRYVVSKYIEINDEIDEDIKINLIKNDKKNKELFDGYRNEYNNDEIVGQIRIENSDFNMLFAKASDNDYYLTHLINREYNRLGATFLDYRCDIDKSKKINIYGHNNGRAGISFNYIMNYENKDFYDNHKYIVISSDEKDYVYEIFSVQIVDSDYIHMKIEFSSDSEWYDYINRVLANSLYKEDVNINSDDRILTLQTCTNRVDWEFLLVNARLIER